MSDVGPWTKFADAPDPAAVAAEPGPWTKFTSAEPKTGKDAGLYSRFLSGFASDQKEQVRMVADRLFPNEPLETSLQRFAQKDGKLVYRADDGETYEAMPHGMVGDLLQGIGPLMPVGGGAVAGALTLPAAATGVGTAVTVGAAAAGAAGGEVARQKLGDYLYGRASTKDLNIPEVIKQGVESGAGQGIGLGFSSLATRGAVRDIAKLDPVATRQNYDKAAAVGVDLTPAEATGLPTLAAQQKRLTNITATADEMRGFLKERDNQVIGAWGNFLDKISGAADAEEVGKLARGAAQGVFKDMRKALSAEATPYYEKAYAAKIPFTKEMQEFTERPTVQEGLSRAFRMMEDEGVDSTLNVIRNNPKTGKFEATAAPDQRTWDYIKRGLDDFISSDAAKNETTGGLNNQGRIAVKQKAQLLDFFDNPKSAAYNPAYKEARQIYSEGAEDVTTAMQSALKLIAESKDTNVLQAARQVFDPRTRSPQMVATLRNAIEGKDPEAWQGLKRLYVQDVSIDALRATELGEIANPAGKIVKAFSNPKVQANLRVGMSSDEWGDFQELMGVFRRAASVPALRSDTEFNRLMSQEAIDEARPLVAKVIRNLNPAQAVRSLEEFMTNRNLDKQAGKVVELVTSGDPDAIKTMRQLRTISPGSKQGLLLLGHLLSRGSTAAAEKAIFSSDESPNQ